MIGEILSISAAFIWALSMVIISKTLKQIDPLNVNALKTLFAAIAMFPIAFFSGEIQNISNLDFFSLIIVIIAALLAFGIGDTSLFKSVTLIGVSKSYTIAYTFPLFTMFFAIIFLGEHFLFKYLIGTAIIFVGIINAFYKKNNNSKKENNLGLLIALITSISWAIASILITIGIRNIGVITANAIRYPFLFVFLIFLTQPWVKRAEFSKKNLYLIAISGILSMVLGGIIFLYGVKIIGISRATSLSASSPVWAILLSKPLLKEKISIRILISALMVIIGTYLLI